MREGKREDSIVRSGILFGDAERIFVSSVGTELEGSAIITQKKSN